MPPELAVEATQATPIVAPAPEAPKVDAAKVETPVAASPEVQAEQTKTEDTSAKPVVPEKYELKLPEGSQLKADALEKIASFAKEQGFTNEQAQKLVDAKSDAVSEFVAQQQEDINKKIRIDWVEEAKADKEIGGEAFGKNAELAKRVVDRYFTDSFKKALNDTGLGNHPELIRGFVRMGKKMSESEFVIPGAQNTGNKKSMEDVFYGGDSIKE